MLEDEKAVFEEALENPREAAYRVGAVCDAMHRDKAKRENGTQHGRREGLPGASVQDGRGRGCRTR